jgi:hypothetical protein
MKPFYCSVCIKSDQPKLGIYYFGKWFVLLALIGSFLGWWGWSTFWFSLLGAIQITYTLE